MHVVIEYKSLTNESRNKIWNGFFSKLERDMEHLSEIVVDARPPKFRHIN
jgi:hypothetical protein